MVPTYHVGTIICEVHLCSFCFRKPDTSPLLRFGQPVYAFQYRSSTVKDRKFLLRTEFDCFTGMESENALFRLFMTSFNNICICRKADFNVLRKDTQPPSL